MSQSLVGQHQQTSFATPINGAAGDATVVLGNDNATVTTYNAHDIDATIHTQDSTAATFAATPAGTAGRKWLTNDSGAVYLYYDTGSAWVEANYLRNTGGTVTGAVTFALAAAAATPTVTTTVSGWVVPSGALVDTTPSVLTAMIAQGANAVTRTYQIVAGTGTSTGIRAFAAGGGTLAAPTATTTSQLLCSITAGGHDGTSWKFVGSEIQFVASENWAVGSQGAQIVFKTTANGTTAILNAVTIGNDKSLTVVGRNITQSTTDATSGTDGSLQTAGGLSVVKKAWIGTGLTIGVGGVTYTTNLISTTALATPGALSATQSTVFASTVNGAAFMGFGTTNDVTLFNRAGTAVIGITANTTGVTMAGALAITGALSGVTTLAASGVVTLSGTSILLSALGVASAIAGTTATGADQTSGALTIKGHVGTGAGAVGGIIFQVPVTHGSDSIAQTLTTVLTLSATATVASTFAGPLAITGALSGVTTAAVSGLITSTATTGIIASATATATPSAYSATQGTFLASTVSGATLMGFGTSSDVTLKNRSGTDVLTVVANTTTVKCATAISVGAATPSTSGAGVSFPAAQSASTDVNTLDDYEEGTWTPSLGGSATYTTQLGTYIKIGKLVWINGIITVNTIGTGSTTTISGLPFTSTNTVAGHQGSAGYFAGLATNVLHIMAYVPGNTTTVGFNSLAAAGTAATNLPAIFGNAATIYFSVCYEATA